MVNGLSKNLNNLSVITSNSQPLNKKMTTEIEEKEKKFQREKKFDSFEPQEKEAVAGIYDIKKDEQGNIQVVFEMPDDSRTTKSSDNLKQRISDKELESDLLSNENQKKIDEDEEEGEKGEKPIIVVTTIDLSAVEREIKELKQQKQQLEQKLVSVSEDEKQAIQSELERVRQELNVKDTEAYRRSHDNRRQYVLD